MFLKVTLSPATIVARVEHGRVADERATVDRLEVVPGRERDDELAVGAALVRPGDREPAEHAAADRLLHRGRVVVVGPEARRAGTRGQLVGERLAGLHRAPLGSEQREGG